MRDRIIKLFERHRASPWKRMEDTYHGQSMERKWYEFPIKTIDNKEVTYDCGITIRNIGTIEHAFVEIEFKQNNGDKAGSYWTMTNNTDPTDILSTILDIVKKDTIPRYEELFPEGKTMKVVLNPTKNGNERNKRAEFYKRYIEKLGRVGSWKLVDSNLYTDRGEDELVFTFNKIDGLEESPVWDDSNKEMSIKTKEHTTNNFRYQLCLKRGKVIGSMNIGNYLIKGFIDPEWSDIYVFSIEGINIVGELDGSIEELSGKKCPKVSSIFVYDEHQRNGLALGMYKLIIDYFGLIISDNSLTGEDMKGGSFDVWKKLGEIYPYKYIATTGNGIVLKAVKEFTRSMMTDSMERFIVSKEPLNELKEAPVFDDSPKRMAYQNPLDKTTDTRTRDIANYNAYKKQSTKFNEIKIGKYRIEGWSSGLGYIIYAFDGNVIVGKLSADNSDNGVLSPMVHIVVVYKAYQGQGIAFAMYKMLIEESGHLSSSNHLSGKEGNGSFDIWEKLSTIYHSYIYDRQLDTLTPVKRFTRKDMKDEYTYFIVSKEILEL